MRIGVVHPTLLKGGGERLAAILMNGLIVKGHDIALAGLQPLGFDISPKIQTHFLSKFFPLKPFIFILTVLKMVFVFKPQAIFFSRIFGLSASFVATILSIICPIPRILYVNVRIDAALINTSGFQDIGKVKKLFMKFFNYLDLCFSIFSMKKAKYVLCNSEFSKELIKWGEVRVIFPPIDTEKFKPNLSKKESNLILYVSRFAPEKKQDIALKLFLHMNKERKYELNLVGHPSFGRFFKTLKAMSEEIPGSNVIADISEQQLIEHYQRATILWFLRRKEPFGLVPIEGMACAAIPIALRGGGVSETIIDKKSGLLCDTYKDLITKTKLVLNDQKLRQKIAQGAIKRANLFRKEIFINKCEKYIKEAFYQRR